MRTVAIILCDNDYGTTFRNLLETVWRVIAWRDKISEEFITQVIRDGMMFHYRAFQQSNIQAYRLDENTVMNWFNKVRILFDEEAEKFIQEHDHDGGSWYLTLVTGNIGSF